jgi:hypothetical protein
MIAWGRYVWYTVCEDESGETVLSRGELLVCGTHLATWQDDSQPIRATHGPEKRKDGSQLDVTGKICRSTRNTFVISGWTRSPQCNIRATVQQGTRGDTSD